MGSAFFGINNIGKAFYIFRKTIIVLDGDLNTYAVFLTREINYLMKSLFVSVEMADKGFYSSIKVKVAFCVRCLLPKMAK